MIFPRSPKTNNDPGPPPDGGLSAWTQAVMGHLVAFNTWGFLASFGTFETFYQSDILSSNSPSDIAWIGSFQLFLIFAIGSIAGRALDAGYFRPVYIMGCVLLILGVFMTSLCHSYWQIFLAQALCAGLGSGLMFTPAIGLVATYFSQKKVFVLAFFLTGAGTGGMVFPALVSHLLPKIGFPWTMRVLGFIMLGTSMLTIVFFRSRLPPRKSGNLVDWAAFRDPTYVMYIAGMWFNFFALYFAFYYIGTFARDEIGLSYQSSVNLLITVNGVGIIGRLVIAYIATKWTSPVTAIIPCALVSAILMYSWSAVTSTGGLYAFAVLYGMASNGVQGLWPGGLSSMILDDSKIGTRMGMGFTIASTALLTGPPVGGALIAKDNGKYLSATVGDCRGRIVARPNTGTVMTPSAFLTEALRMTHLVHSTIPAAKQSYNAWTVSENGVSFCLIPGEPNTAKLATARPNVGEAKAKDLDNAQEYDYIIIGTGTAGCVLASRLSEDQDVSILAIEAGHSDLKQLFSRIPAAFGRLFSTAADWNYYTEREDGCNGRKLFWPRGKMLAINAMIYNKGSPGDYDEWEKLGNNGWGFRDLTEYMKKCEGFNENHPSTLATENLVHHGRDGPWQTGYSHLDKLSEMFLNACEAVGITKVQDFNTPNGMLGASQFQTFIDPRGQRSSTSVAYLTEDVASRSNLSIATGQTVTKILFDSSSRQPRAIGVEMASSKNSPLRYIAKAKREVILSAGAIQSPQVLKLSGIGPADELKHHGISIVKDVPGVGENLADHLSSIICFESKLPSLQYLFHPIHSLPALVEWLRFGKGAMTTNAAEAGCFLRTSDRPDAPSSLRTNDAASDSGAPDLELLIGPLSYINHGRTVAPTSKNWFSIGPILLRPESRGTITLASSSPFDAPIINANYLSTELDRQRMVYGMRLCRDISLAKPFREAFSSWYFPSADIGTMSDEALLEAVRNHSETIYHPMGSVKMGPSSNPTSVVDSTLRLHGVQGLRVVDASILPEASCLSPMRSGGNGCRESCRHDQIDEGNLVMKNVICKVEFAAPTSDDKDGIGSVAMGSRPTSEAPGLKRCT
nr:putative gmc-type oxidoreductase [Quercus suber]